MPQPPLLDQTCLQWRLFPWRPMSPAPSYKTKLTVSRADLLPAFGRALVAAR
jgi:hypothetical protein